MKAFAGAAVFAALAVACGGGDAAPGGGGVRIAVGGTRSCVLVADTAAERQRGLMGRRSLGPYEGMLFVFDADTTGGFWMKDTPLALSIAWFDAGGGLVSTADMATCPDGDCPTYRPDGPYRYALEVRRGELSRVGVGTSARLAVSDDAC